MAEHMQEEQSKRIVGREKQAVYIVLNERLSNAMRKGFWFEACMIEYAIMEDRTSSILAHARVKKNAYSKDLKMRPKLRSITAQIEQKHKIVSKKVSPATIAAIGVWIDKRNDAVHRACIRRYSEDEMRELAEEGRELVRAISRDSQKVARLATKVYGE